MRKHNFKIGVTYIQPDGIFYRCSTNKSLNPSSRDSEKRGGTLDLAVPPSSFTQIPY